jgi:hypothetical protein
VEIFVTDQYGESAAGNPDGNYGMAFLILNVKCWMLNKMGTHI